MSEARERFMGFMRGRVCHFLMQGDHLNLLEAMLYLLPDVPREERHDLLTDMRTCFASDAAVLAELAHQALVVSRVLATADGAAVPPPKRSFARRRTSRRKEETREKKRSRTRPRARATLYVRTRELPAA